MTSPDQSSLDPGGLTLEPDDVAMIVDAFIANAQRLGLKWFIRPATVVNGLDTSAIQVRIDGDREPTVVTSMIGQLTTSKRVFLLIIPEIGTYVVGWMGIPHYIFNGETGVEVWTFVTQTSQTRAVTFKKRFSSPPFVSCTIVSASGTTQGWFARPSAVTATGFTMWVHGPSSSWTNISVRWSATETAAA